MKVMIVVRRSEDSPFNKGTGHHVAQTSRSSCDDANFSFQRKRSERSLGVLSVTSPNDIVSWVVFAPFLFLSAPLDGIATVGNVQLAV